MALRNDKPVLAAKLSLLARAEARKAIHANKGEEPKDVATDTPEETKAAEAEFAKKAAEAETRIRAATDAALANVKAVAGEAADALVEKLAGAKPKRGAITAALEAADRG